MNDDNTLQAVPTTDTIYIVKGGDSLSKIALRFYGDASLYPRIAEYNRINPNGIITIGQRLVIPARASADELREVQITAQRLPVIAPPASPGGSTPEVYQGETIETVTTTASRIKFWEDWRFWLAVAGVAGLIWFMTRRGKRS